MLNGIVVTRQFCAHVDDEKRNDVDILTSIIRLQRWMDFDRIPNEPLEMFHRRFMYDTETKS